MFHQTPGYLCGGSLNNTLDRLQTTSETITNEKMVNIKTQLEAFVGGIDAVRGDASPDQAASLSNIF